MILHLEI